MNEAEYEARAGAEAALSAASATLLLPEQSERVEQTLYHYTTAVGLAGILKTKTLWFTDFRHLSDPGELAYGAKIAVEELVRAHGVHPALKVLINKTISILNLTVQGKSSNEFFIASLSSDRDSLGQWREYADRGRGYAIGFHPEVFALQDDASKFPPNERTFVATVVYDEIRLRARMAGVAEDGCLAFQAALGTSGLQLDDDRLTSSFAADLAINFLWLCLATKHPAYANEAEVRMLLVGASVRPFVKARFRGNVIIPYIESPLPISPEADRIVEIVAGPATHPDAERTVGMLLSSLQLPALPVRRSTIPYRPF